MSQGLTTGSAGSELTGGSPDFQLLFFGYPQGPHSLVPRDSKFRIIPALPSSGGAGRESPLALYEPLVSWASPLDISSISELHRLPRAALHG